MADIVLRLLLDDKEVNAKLLDADKIIDQIKKGTADTSKEMSQMGNIVTGFKNALDLAKQSMDALKTIVMDGAGLQVLRKNFQGTAEDIELLRKATSGIVTEANLIKLSNQAADLGLSVKDQAILFDLADDAADKYGTTIEEGFKKILMSTEGATRGLREMGIQGEKYEQILDKLAAAEGRTIENLDAETQKRLRLQAIVIASGKSLEDLNTKVVDNDDKMQQLGVRMEEGKQAIGNLIAEGLIPLIDNFNKSGPAGDVLLGALSGIYGIIVPLIPVYAQLTAAKAMMTSANVTEAASVTALSGSYLKLFGYLGIGAAAGYGAGMLWDELHDPVGAGGLANRWGSDTETKANDQKVNDLFNSSKRFVPGVGWISLKQNDALKPVQTIQDAKNEIEKLNTELLGVELNSKRHLEILARIESLNRPELPEFYKSMFDEYGNEILPDDDLLGDIPWKEIEQLKIDAMREGFGKRDALIELWYAEQKETKLYRESIEARTAIDEQYNLKKKENQVLFEELGAEQQALIAGLSDAGRTFWDQFIIGGRQAKDEWDALWLSFRNSALQHLGEIIQNELFASLTQSAGGKSEGGFDFFGTLMSILPFFGQGGIVTSPTMAVVGDVPEAIIPLHKLGSFGSGNVEKKLDQVIAAFREKQFEIDVFKLRTVNKRMDQIEKQLLGKQ